MSQASNSDDSDLHSGPYVPFKRTVYCGPCTEERSVLAWEAFVELEEEVSGALEGGGIASEVWAVGVFEVETEVVLAGSAFVASPTGVLEDSKAYVVAYLDIGHFFADSFDAANDFVPWDKGEDRTVSPETSGGEEVRLAEACVSYFDSYLVVEEWRLTEGKGCHC